MALLSDFFITTPSELNSLDINQSPAKLLPSIQSRSIDVVKLTQLQCVIDGSTFEEHLKELDNMIVKSASDDGPWIVLVPNAVTKALAESDQARLENIGRSWASTEEWTRDGGKKQEIISVVKDIAKLAQQTEFDKQNLYIWVCL
jgi:hypothetical protein